MKATFPIDGKEYRVDFSRPNDISIRLEFDRETKNPQPNAFGLPRARASAFEAGDFVGNTRRGGSANCFDVFLNPHGNGTHTECVGHIVDEHVGVGDVLQDTVSPAVLISVAPRRMEDCDETYEGDGLATDALICAESITAALERLNVADFRFRSLAIRTLPNPHSKQHTNYSGTNPPYLSSEAMKLVRELGVKHLLVDVPSVDREEDQGRLSNHHTFWEVPQGTHRLMNVPSARTITEMIFVPDEVTDGLYLLSIQIPEFNLDAAPSRPRLFELTPAD